MSKSTLSKQKLAQNVADKLNLPPSQVNKVINTVVDTLIEVLKNGDRVEFRRFGVFEVVTRKPKIGRNPKNTAQTVMIPERSVVKFTPGKELQLH